MRLLLLVPFLFACAPAPTAGAQDFQLPIDCAVGETCVVQNYADVNPADGAAADPRCGPLTYDGHDGIDIRAPALMARSGVAVLSPAAGVVVGVRDGEPDGAFLSGGAAAVQGRECGNGVRIEHADGWSSQLCHMRSGSVRVREGDRVTAGQALGLVGLSGHTQFNHVHMALRRNGETLDPLTGAALGQSACGNAVAPGRHWSASARAALGYRGTVWFGAGFTNAAPAQGADAETLPQDVSRQSPALLFWALASGPRNADVLRVRLFGPDGSLIAEGDRTQPRDQAQAWVYAGRRTPPGGWPAGSYRGEAQLVREGRVIATRSETLTLR